MARSIRPPQPLAGERASPGDPSRLSELERRLARIEATFDRATSARSCAETKIPPDVPLKAHRNRYVTHEELTELLGRMEIRLDTRIAEEFDNQMLAIGSLRAMIAGTDILLERVLSRLESSAGDADDQFDALPSDMSDLPPGLRPDSRPDLRIDERFIGEENRGVKKPVSTSIG